MQRFGSLCRKVPLAPTHGLVLGIGGVVCDKHGLAPVIAIQMAARTFGMDIVSNDIVPFLGLGKKQHLLEMMQVPHLRQKFHLAHDRPFDNDRDLETFLTLYEHEQLSLLRRIPLFSELLPEFDAMMQHLPPHLAYCLTSGYRLPVVQELLQRFTKHGFLPDAVVCSSHTPHRKDMILECLKQIRVPPARAAFVGDQQTDIDSARLAKVGFVVGVTHSIANFQGADAVCANMIDVGKSIQSWFLQCP